jgi:ABC-2 type transport system ATP-binding protein
MDNSQTDTPRPASEIHPAISIRGISKTFPIPFRRERVVAVKQLTIEVMPGEVYGLLGPNGSGKSTAMKILLGLVRADAGTTSIFGRESTDVSSREQVGYLPENPYFYKYLTGLETLLFYGRICGMRGPELRDRAMELLALVGLEKARDRRLGGYSKGMLQRIGLGQALIQHPRLLVLDEPTAGVDPAGSRQIRDLILKLQSEGITVMLCSHFLEQVQAICSRVGILHEGNLVREGTLEELVAVRDQTEMVIDSATPALIGEIRAAAEKAGGHVVSCGRPERTLEGVYLEATGGPT